jgi:hypothetical protein
MSAFIRAADANRVGLRFDIQSSHEGRMATGARFVMTAMVDDSDEAAEGMADASGNIIAELEPSKDGEVGLQFVSRLKQVDVGRDTDGDTITSCVIEETMVSAAPSIRPIQLRWLGMLRRLDLPPIPARRYWKSFNALTRVS